MVILPTTGKEKGKKILTYKRILSIIVKLTCKTVTVVSSSPFSKLKSLQNENKKWIAFTKISVLLSFEGLEIKYHAQNVSQ